MKKALAIIILSFVYHISVGQEMIQSNFFGHQLSKYYIKEAIYKLAYDIDGVPDNFNVEATNLRFGGRDWKIGTFSFYDILGEGDGGYLYMVSFSTPYKTKELCMTSYNELLKALSSKYGKGNVIDNHEEKSSSWTDDQRFCLLSAYQSESRGGELFWYLNLEYWDSQLFRHKMNSEENEL